MKGIQYLVNELGEKTAIQIDLKEYGELWEDFYDSFITEERMNEPRESYESVKLRLRKQGKRSG